MKKYLLFLLLPWALFSDSPQPPLWVGMELTHPPFETICNDNMPCGITVDIINAFSASVHRKTEILNIPFVGLILSLQNKTIEVIASSLPITEQGKKEIAFSDPYVTLGLCLLIGIDSQVKNIEDANKEGRVIVVKSGTSGELYAREHLKKATIRALNTESACVLEVVQERADAFIYDQLSIYANWKKYPARTKANLVPFQKEYWGFGVRKDDPELLEQINRFLLKFHESGGFDKLAYKYFPEQKEAFNKLGIRFIF
jgi:polar amino acid transport system substrate-binding protein